MNLENDPRTASNRFKRCPVCGNSDLLSVENELICFKCEWNSIASSVASGIYDSWWRVPISKEKRRYSKSKDKNRSDVQSQPQVMFKRASGGAP